MNWTPASWPKRPAFTAVIARLIDKAALAASNAA